jgi:Rrf2 family protein
MSMQISARADYALRTCVILAQEEASAGRHDLPPRPLAAEVIALHADLPTRFLETVIARLRQGGIVHSQRGSAGGCTLARSADSITLLEIVSSVDGAPMLVRGLDPHELDYDDHAPGLTAAYLALQTAVVAQLSETTLASLVVVTETERVVTNVGNSQLN